MPGEAHGVHAAYVTEPGPPEAIRWGELPPPVVGPTDVLVRVTAVAVNPVDILVRSGAYRTPMPLPFIIGRDLVGEVVDAGPGAAEFAPGDRVWCDSLGHGGRQGSFADRVVVSADRLYRLPPDADPVDAVAVLHPTATAWLALFRHAGLRAGETVYVGGGGGNVGQALIALAADAGARVIATARPADDDRCRRAGADVVVDYRDPACADRLREASPEGVDVHVDTSGRQNLDEAVGLLAHGGRLVLLAGFTRRDELTFASLYTRDARLVGFVISNASVTDLADAAVAIDRLLVVGRPSPRVADVLPLHEAAEAHRRLEAGGVHGRLVLRP